MDRPEPRVGHRGSGLVGAPVEGDGEGGREKLERPEYREGRPKLGRRGRGADTARRSVQGAGGCIQQHQRQQNKGPDGAGNGGGDRRQTRFGMDLRPAHGLKSASHLAENPRQEGGSQ
jgi:hypothetical protein